MMCKLDGGFRPKFPYSGEIQGIEGESLVVYREPSNRSRLPDKAFYVHILKGHPHEALSQPVRHCAIKNGLA